LVCGKWEVIFQTPDSVPQQERPSPQQTALGQASEFHKRAGASHAEARKLLTAMAVGSVGVLYATLTGKDAPTLEACTKSLAFLSIVAMALSAGCGLFAWRADSAWAFRAAKNFQKDPALDAPDGGRWHDVKKSLDVAQLTLFVFGLAVAVALTLRLLK
jgi:hypothetical protein